MESGERRNRSGRKFKPSVRRSYESSFRLYLDRQLGSIKVDDVRRRDIQEVVDRLALEHSGSTVRNAVMPLRSYYRWAVARDIVAINPTTGIEMPALDGRRDRIATAPEARVLIQTLPTTDRPLWATLFYAGLRVGEARALRIEDIDLGEGLIKVRRSWDPEAGPVAPKSSASNRSVPVPGVLMGVLKSHLDGLKWNSGLAFGRDPDSPFNPSSITQRADRLWKSAKLLRITPHEARHTFASLMIEAMKRDQTLNVKVLSTIMGHSSIATTYDIYGHLLPGSETEAAAAFDAYLAATI